jgi:predicted RNase H-like HicB family nuclease/DNA-binding XRE family transcriptional regulator
MKLEGTYKKDGKFWISEIPFIQFMDQGISKKECLAMVKSAIETLVNKKGFSCEVEDVGEGQFLLSSDDTGMLASFIFKRLRESNGLTIRDMAKRLHLKSPTSYARHENGHTAITMDKFGEYVHAITRRDMVVKIA